MDAAAVLLLIIVFKVVKLPVWLGQLSWALVTTPVRRLKWMTAAYWQHGKGVKGYYPAGCVQFFIHVDQDTMKPVCEQQR